MKNRLMMLILALFVFIPFSVNAATINNNEDFINALGGNEYAKLIDGEIVLEQNITLVEEIKLERGTYILDLNGKNILDSANVKDYIIQLNDATLTINDSGETGKIESTIGNRTLWVEENGNLTINGGNIKGHDTIISYKGSSITINDGTFEANASALCIYGGNVTINNGTFKTSDRDAIYLAVGENSDEILIINDGNFEGLIPIYHDSGNFIINGGKFKGEHYALFTNLNYISESKINEGQFDGGIGLYQNETVHSPVITVDSGSIYNLIPTLLGDDSRLNPNGIINKIEDTENGFHDLKIFKTENNVEVLKVLDVIIKFDANGGTFESSSILTIDGWVNGLENSLEEPTRDGYAFMGYFTEKTGGTKLELILAESGIDSDMTFYAQWEETTSNVPGETEDENSGVIPSEPEEENPKTFDGIGTSIFMGTISLIGLVGATIYLKRKSKVRA